MILVELDSVTIQRERHEILPGATLMEGGGALLSYRPSYVKFEV